VFEARVINLCDRDIETVAMEWLLGDEDVWSPVLEYRLNRALTFDPTIGSRLKFSRGCFPCGRYGMATR
jgi:hypothetical protein